MLFATWLVSARHLAPSSLSVYLAAVRSLTQQFDRGFPDPMVSTSRLHRLIRGIKRSAAPSRLSRLPITAPLLSVIHRSLALDLFDHRMFWAACCLAFFGFLRVAEFTCPTTFDPSTHLTPADVSLADAVPSISGSRPPRRTPSAKVSCCTLDPLGIRYALSSPCARTWPYGGSPRDPYSSRRLAYHCLLLLSTTGYVPSSPQLDMGRHSAATVSVLGRLHPQQPRAFRIT